MITKHNVNTPLTKTKTKTMEEHIHGVVNDMKKLLENVDCVVTYILDFETNDLWTHGLENMCYTLSEILFKDISNFRFHILHTCNVILQRMCQWYGSTSYLLSYSSSNIIKLHFQNTKWKDIWRHFRLFLLQQTLSLNRYLHMETHTRIEILQLLHWSLLLNGSSFVTDFTNDKNQYITMATRRLPNTSNSNTDIGVKPLPR
ncbi:hypothetical protein RFI_34267, partial [Reticulomyxa filosa]